MNELASSTRVNRLGYQYRFIVSIINFHFEKLKISKYYKKFSFKIRQIKNFKLTFKYHKFLSFKMKYVKSLN